MLTPVQTVYGATNYRRARTTNQSGAPSAPVAQLAQPTGEGVLDVLVESGWVPSFVKLIPFGSGADNSTLTIQVIGWHEAGGVWVPTILFQSTATLSTFVGVGTTTGLRAADRVADTIADPAAGKGTKNVDCWIGTPADNTPAHVVVDTKGCREIEVRMGDTGNALYAWL